MTIKKEMSGADQMEIVRYFSGDFGIHLGTEHRKEIKKELEKRNIEFDNDLLDELLECIIERLELESNMVNGDM
jgi:hypothetical protein